jgi:hypothetical protein
MSNVWVYSRSLAGIADSNPAGSMDVSYNSSMIPAGSNLGEYYQKL